MKEKEPKAPRGIIVRDGDHGLPYSKGLTANTVIASGLSPENAPIPKCLETRCVR